MQALSTLNLSSNDQPDQIRVLSDMRRPFGAFLFVGPTGVGKTHLAQFLAEVLFGHRDRIVRLNMADYPLERHGQLLFGDPDDHRQFADT